MPGGSSTTCATTSADASARWSSRVSRLPARSAAGWSTAEHGRQLHTALRRLRRLLAMGCFGAAGQPLAPELAKLQVALAAEGAAALLLARPATQQLWLDLLALGLPMA